MSHTEFRYTKARKNAHIYESEQDVKKDILHLIGCHNTGVGEVGAAYHPQYIIDLLDVLEDKFFIEEYEYLII